MLHLKYSMGCSCYSYHLALDQQLEDTLPGFSQYLVLTQTTSLQQSCRRILTVDGEIVNAAEMPMSWDGCTDGGVVARVLPLDLRMGDVLENPDADELFAAEFRLCVYNEHARFHVLNAATIRERLQLAALYAATTTPLREVRTRMTGVEYALDLLRQCWVQHPLTDIEIDKLENVFDICEGESSVRLLCFVVGRSSMLLQFLHRDATAETTEEGGIPDNLKWAYEPDALITTNYMHLRDTHQLNRRLLLTREEEDMCHVAPLSCTQRHQMHFNHGFSHTRYPDVSAEMDLAALQQVSTLGAAPSAPGYVKYIENTIARLTEPAPSQRREFPIDMHGVGPSSVDTCGWRTFKSHTCHT